MSRVQFRDELIRNDFFLMVRTQGKFESWKSLRQTLKIPKTVFERYRTGEHLISSERYATLIGFLTEDQKYHFNKTIELFDRNWGSRKGGIRTYTEHPEIFEKGRRVSWEKRVVKDLFNAELLNDEEFCEFVGAFIGDGFTNEYNKHYLTQFTGDYRHDKEYYQRFIIPFLKKKLHLQSTLIQEDNTLRLNIYSKLLFIFLTKELKMPAGKKCYTVKIPQEITDDISITEVLRGLFDTDGYFFVDQRKCYHKAYPRIGLQLANKELIQSVHALLLDYGLNPCLNKKGTLIQINGDISTKNFLEKIGFRNKRHISRIKKFRPDLLQEY